MSLDFRKLFSFTTSKKDSVKFILDEDAISKIKRVQNILDYKIRDINHFILALTHRSYFEEEEKAFSYERMEFLGDAVLGLVVAEYLFNNFPKEDEGFLTKIRTNLVNRAMLSNSAKRMNLKEYMLYHKSLNDSPKALSSLGSNALEALIAAIYLDGGLEKAKNFICKKIIDPNIKEGKLLDDQNYKSQLLEYAQAEKLNLPFYKLLKEEGPDHNKVFTIGVFLNEEMLGVGSGKNKKNAEQIAAKAALLKILNSD